MTHFEARLGTHPTPPLSPWLTRSRDTKRLRTPQWGVNGQRVWQQAPPDLCHHSPRAAPAAGLPRETQTEDPAPGLAWYMRRSSRNYRHMTGPRAAAPCAATACRDHAKRTAARRITRTSAKRYPAGPIPHTPQPPPLHVRF